MALWSGAAQALLQAVGAGTSAKQVQFIRDWNTHATTACRNNPVDVSHPEPGATDCRQLSVVKGYTTRTAKNYVSRPQAIAAFKAQAESGLFPHLLAAMRHADPFNFLHDDLVVGDLNKWGSAKFATFYADAISSGGVGVGGGITAAGHAGFRSFQKSMAHSLPTNLRKSKIIRHRVMRKTGL